MKKIVYSPNYKKNILHTKKSTSITNKKIYTIVWRDAYSSEDIWYDENSHDNSDYLVVTTGYLINSEESNPNYYTIASTITQSGNFCSVINIPKDMVVTKTRLVRN
jgi:hypothetical protein